MLFLQRSPTSFECKPFYPMEFVEYIKSPKIDKVSLRRRGREYLEGTLCVTGHHLIFSSRTEHKDELIVSHWQRTVNPKIFMCMLLKLFLNFLEFISVKIVNAVVFADHSVCRCYIMVTCARVPEGSRAEAGEGGGGGGEVLVPWNYI